MPNDSLPSHSAEAEAAEYSGPQVTVQGWQGPLPPPAALEAFERIVPGSGATIIREFQQEAAHRRALEIVQAAQIGRETLMGQVLALIFAAGALGATAFAIHEQHVTRNRQARAAEGEPGRLVVAPPHPAAPPRLPPLRQAARPAARDCAVPVSLSTPHLCVRCGKPVYNRLRPSTEPGKVRFPASRLRRPERRVSGRRSTTAVDPTRTLRSCTQTSIVGA